MVNTKTRKAVYVPGELWEKLSADARPNYDSVTTVLKNILLEHYNKTSEFKKIPLAPKETAGVGDGLDEF